MEATVRRVRSLSRHLYLSSEGVFAGVKNIMDKGKNNKIKWVFIGPKVEMIDIQYKGFQNDGNSLIMIPNAIRLPMKALTLSKIGSSKILDKPFGVVYKKIIKNRIRNGSHMKGRICFILYGRIYESCGSSIIRFLRENYEGCKIVCYFGDLVKRHKCSLKKAKDEFDDVFIFDEKEAEKKKIKYCLEPFSVEALKGKGFETDNFEWDVTFVGTSKNRYERIIELYEKLRRYGLRCDFHIVGVKKNEQLYQGEIGYKPLSFTELLDHVNRSRFVAEVLQGGGYSPTTRYTEAMLFGRNLLTDCEYFSNPANRSPNIFYFDKLEEIDEKKVKELRKKITFDRSAFIEMFSVNAMIKTISSELSL